MSDERQETISDIVADIRAQNQGLPEDSYALSPLVCDLLSIADRIEAAANHQFREVAKMIPHEEVDVSKMETTTPTSEKSSSVGNAEAMREALEKIANMGEEIDYQLGSSDETVYAFRHERSLAYNISECARTALSAPPRNCDRYTLSEALRKYGFPTKSKPWGEKEWLDFCEWYISEAKGETFLRVAKGGAK